MECEGDLKERLEKYIERFNGKVKIIRNSKQEGLVKARVIGAEAAIGDVIVILDAHCECVTNWLPPLLQRIALNRYLFCFLNLLTIVCYSGLLRKRIFAR